MSAPEIEVGMEVEFVYPDDDGTQRELDRQRYNHTGVVVGMTEGEFGEVAIERTTHPYMGEVWFAFPRSLQIVGGAA